VCPYSNATRGNIDVDLEIVWSGAGPCAWSPRPSPMRRARAFLHALVALLR